MRAVLFLAMLAATLVPAGTASAQTAAEKHLAQQIGSHLKQSGQLRNYRVGVKYHNGVAYLAGSVDSPEQRDLAAQLAQEVEGVSHVINRLEISGGRGPSTGNEDPNATDNEDTTEPLNRTSFDGPQNDAPGVMHAYQHAGPPQAEATQQMPMQQMPMPPNPMMQRQVARANGPQARRNNMPLPAGRLPGILPIGQGGPSGVRQASGACQCDGGMAPGMGAPCMGGMGGMGGCDAAPNGFVPAGSGRGPSYDNAQMPGYAWPSYASYPNYAALSYPQQYSPTAWPYIGPFYPYPQVPLAWRKVSLEWDDGWWFLDFSAHNSSH